ncbi:unnamed protein product [Effrenium voratum]|uniref:Opioid growth factor receptor (OGFr) conserved domain-containing protein n=1 Tax=Effrenium voratum TaxID=2562239 RepID=A0AA36I9D6_9DINO|nr:unnamed protein product [Effrenium voratum]
MNDTVASSQLQSDCTCAAGMLRGFLRGEGPDSENRMLMDILRWGDMDMERVHNYVQWIFPTDEASMFNMDAPLMTPAVQEICRNDPVIQQNFDHILARFLSFLGLQMAENDGKFKVSRAKHFDTRVPDCWSSMFGMGRNHNWLRISRVLHCLGMIGKKAEQQALMQFLETMVSDFPDIRSAVPHWRGRAQEG